MEEDSNGDELDTRALEVEACELDRAITSLLQAHDSKANEWLNGFVVLPRAWTVSLYLAFPPPGSAAGRSEDVRFFALNLLLSKIRGDRSQVPADEAYEIYEALMRQLPLNLGNRTVGARLCLVVSGAAALAGADTCYDLVEYIVSGSVDGSLAVELLISLAEETLHRTTALPWQVGECMQYCSPQVISYLQVLVAAPGVQQDFVARIIVCFERWIRSGVVLSEFYLNNASLLRMILEALGSSDDACFEGAVGSLSELICAVDPLPGREDAVRAVISAVLAQKGQFVAAITSFSDTAIKRAQALLSLVSVICCSEPYLLAKGGQDAADLFEWLILGIGGVGNLGLDASSIAAEPWPRIVGVPKSKRSELLQSPLFAACAQAILQSTAYPSDFSTWEESEVEEDEFYRFREGLAKDTLIACFNELGSALLVYIIDRFRGANRWQDFEVCLYAAISLSNEILNPVADNHLDCDAGKSFFLTIITALPGSSAVTHLDSASLPHPKLVETTAIFLETYADWAALDPNALQTSLSYSVGALYLPGARSRAASALREICRAAAPSITAAGMLPALMDACEKAMKTSFHGVSESSDRLALIKGLAQVAVALPLEEAKSALISLTTPAVCAVKALAGARDVLENGPRLAEALRVLVVAIGCGDASVYNHSSTAHPGVVIIEEIWPAINVISTVWVEDGDVSSAVCELWSMSARKVGGVLSGVIVQVIIAASTLFKRHYAPACVDCLVDMLALASQDSGIFQQVREHSGNIILELSDVGVYLAQLSAELSVGSKSTSSLVIFTERNGHDQVILQRKQQSVAAGLLALCRLGRAFLRHHRYTLTHVTAFSNLVNCGIECLRRRYMGPSLSAVKFLAEIAMGFGYSDEDNIDRIEWRIEANLSTCWDEILGPHLNLVVEIALQTAAGSEIVPSTRDALSDIFYGLCLRNARDCEAALKSAVNSPNFPCKSGVLTESVKSTFVAAAVRQPVHHRRRFRELIGDFARVCQGQMPPDVLHRYNPID